MTNQTYGNYGLRPTGHFEYLTLAFSPLSTPLRSRWRNNGLSADFLSDYVITFLPKDGDIASERQQRDIRYMVSYIANELLENAMKYHAQLVDTPIRLNLELTQDQITVSASNGISEDQAASYAAFVESLLASDPNDLLTRKLEEAGLSDDSDSSGLGLLTMVTDHGAKLGWKFESDPTGVNGNTVTTSAVLSLAKIFGSGA